MLLTYTPPPPRSPYHHTHTFIRSVMYQSVYNMVSISEIPNSCRFITSHVQGHVQGHVLKVMFKVMFKVNILDKTFFFFVFLSYSLFCMLHFSLNFNNIILIKKTGHNCGDPSWVQFLEIMYHFLQSKLISVYLKDIFLFHNKSGQCLKIEKNS